MNRIEQRVRVQRGWQADGWFVRMDVFRFDSIRSTLGTTETELSTFRSDAEGVRAHANMRAGMYYLSGHALHCTALHGMRV